MKTLGLFAGVLAGCAALAAPGNSVITEWNFNLTDSVAASIGSGEFRLLGGVISTNFQGSASDPDTPNGAISLRAFPPQATSPKSAGLEFTTSTRGWIDLGLRFEIRASATANRWLRVLAIPNGGETIDAGVVEILRDGVFTEVLIDLSNDSRLSDAASLTVQIVSDVGGDGEYQGVKPKTDGSNSYSSSGTWRFDRLALLGTAKEANLQLPLVVARSGEQLTLSWTERVGESCTVWRASTLSGPWTSVSTATAQNYSDLIVAEPQYYRVTSP